MWSSHEMSACKCFTAVQHHRRYYTVSDNKQGTACNCHQRMPSHSRIHSISNSILVALLYFWNNSNWSDPISIIFRKTNHYVITTYSFAKCDKHGITPTTTACNCHQRMPIHSRIHSISNSILVALLYFWNNFNWSDPISIIFRKMNHYVITTYSFAKCDKHGITPTTTRHIMVPNMVEWIQVKTNALWNL